MMIFLLIIVLIVCLLLILGVETFKFMVLSIICALVMKIMKQKEIAYMMILVMVLGVVGQIYTWTQGYKRSAGNLLDSVNNMTYSINRLTTTVNKANEVKDRVENTRNKVEDIVQPLDNLDKSIKNKVNGLLGREEEE